MSARLVLLLCSVLCVVACGEDHSRDDAGTDAGPRDGGPRPDGGRPDGGVTCILDAECDDGVYCNGREDCDPIDTRADDFGCVVGNNPCIDGLICTVEPDPACNEAGRTCASATLDHSMCPPGAYCLANVGCSDVDPCPADGSPCPDEDGDPCQVPTCDAELIPPLCIPAPAPDDTPCTSATGATGICRLGSCCTDCT